VSLRFLLIGFVIALAGCNVVPQSETVRQFTLPQNAIDFDDAERKIPVNLRVQTPESSGVIGSKRIAVLPGGSEIQAYGGARWSEPAPNLLRDRLIEAFMASGRLASVYDGGTGVAADYRLLSRLRAFQSEYVEGEPQVIILLDALLTGSDGREVIASERFEVRETSPSEDIDAVVQSFGRASDRLSEQVVEWTTEKIAEVEEIR
jgi:cholesterol transport system auxiliary component